MTQPAAQETVKPDVPQSSKRAWRRPQWRARNVRTHC